MKEHIGAASDRDPPPREKPWAACGRGGAEELKEKGDQQRAGTAAQTGRPQEGREPASWRREGASGQLGSQAWLLRLLVVVLTGTPSRVVPVMGVSRAQVLHSPGVSL